MSTTHTDTHTPHTPHTHTHHHTCGTAYMDMHMYQSIIRAGSTEFDGHRLTTVQFEIITLKPGS